MQSILCRTRHALNTKTARGDQSADAIETTYIPLRVPFTSQKTRNMKASGSLVLSCFVGAARESENQRQE
jgi:hypothetical protein